MSDAELLHMLRQNPKNVPQLHSRDSFRKFFAGIALKRMAGLLEQAYADLPKEEREEKVQKRLELMSGLLAE